MGQSFAFVGEACNQGNPRILEKLRFFWADTALLTQLQPH